MAIININDAPEYEGDDYMIEIYKSDLDAQRENCFLYGAGWGAFAVALLGYVWLRFF